MPCDKHSHPLWPRNGSRRLLIESCETRCGWCNYKNAKANNLRAHARRHVMNPLEERLKDIVIVACKAGRGRVTMSPSMDSITPDTPVLPFTESTTSPDDSLHHSRTRDPSHRAQPEAIDESMVLKQRNAMLENILLEKGIDIEAELQAKSYAGTFPPPRAIGTHELLVAANSFGHIKSNMRHTLSSESISSMETESLHHEGNNTAMSPPQAQTYENVYLSQPNSERGPIGFSPQHNQLAAQSGSWKARHGESSVSSQSPSSSITPDQAEGYSQETYSTGSDFGLPLESSSQNSLQDSLLITQKPKLVRKESLREKFFPTWKGNPDVHELDREQAEDKDPLGTQIWKLYSKTKSQLPNQERMENLTWRMMAMSLRKRKQEEAARLSVDSACRPTQIEKVSNEISTNSKESSPSATNLDDMIFSGSMYNDSPGLHVPLANTNDEALHAEFTRSFDDEIEASRGMIAMSQASLTNPGSSATQVGFETGHAESGGWSAISPPYNDLNSPDAYFRLTYSQY